MPKTTIFFQRAFFRLLCTTILCALIAHGEELQTDENTSDAVEDNELDSQIENMGQNMPATNDVVFVYGNDIWQPGWAISNQRSWLALSCNAAGCAFTPATLMLSAASWQGYYDSRATSGQKLSFKIPETSLTTKSKPSTTTTLWFQMSQDFSWLKIGPVKTYYVAGFSSADFPAYQQSSNNSFELSIKNPAGETERLVPVLLAAAQDNHAEASDTAATYPDLRTNGYLQLRAHGKRQLLQEPMAACSGQLSNDYLLWAGDMDADGKTDYVLNFADGPTGTISLYLSGRATDADLVGKAGSALTEPLDGECD